MKDRLDSRTIKPGIYRHYKGNDYRVIETAYHSETEELLVLYHPMYGESALWARPFDMFVETLEVNGETVNRFQLIEN